MPRTILTIAQEAAERDATAPAPSALFGTNTRVAKILRTAAHDVLRDYLRRTRWVGLSEFHSTWTFALKPSTYAYRLPPDFLRVIPQTEQRNGWPMGLVGPATPQAWSWWLYGGVAQVSPHGWRIKNNALWIDPTPTAEELVTIEYISRYPVVSGIQDGDLDLTSEPIQIVEPAVSRDGWLYLTNDDLLGTPGDGVFRYGTVGVGYDVGLWGESASEYLKRLDPQSQVQPVPQVRREAFTTDNDYPAFEDDHLLSLGMTWHLQRALGLPYAERAAEYEAELEVKIAEDAGGARGFRLGSSGQEWDCYPLEDGVTGNGRIWSVT
ncbi:MULTISPECIES: hypothetical protein [unclassified Mameliella]|uniref:phage adaptor protein n=1 Tax=unclassified Mameliella TaxID=2630630 RepID=UPI00273F087A|nr:MULTISPECIES: hypothetical protein [unclassified Mameliella]